MDEGVFRKKKVHNFVEKTLVSFYQENADNWVELESKTRTIGKWKKNNWDRFLCDVSRVDFELIKISLAK